MERAPPSAFAVQARRPLLIVVEGINDIEFLTRLSRRLASSHPDLPNLSELADQGRIVFIPFGGGSPAVWSHRLAPLNCPEFHLYDREVPPESRLRLEAAEMVNARANCRAFVTRMRSLESYLHSDAIEEAGGERISFGDDDCVGTVLARQWHESMPRSRIWDELPIRRRRHLVHRAKRWLNTVAVEQMTAERLAEREPVGEVAGWLRTIGEMVQACGSSTVAGHQPRQ